MNNLEDQLKASRQSEIPGLRPPAGGWEAIKQQLPAADPEVPGKLSGGFDTLPFYWLLGAAVLLLICISSLPNTSATKQDNDYVDLPKEAPASSPTGKKVERNEPDKEKALAASANDAGHSGDEEIPVREEALTATSQNSSTAAVRSGDKGALLNGIIPGRTVNPALPANDLGTGKGELLPADNDLNEAVDAPSTNDAESAATPKINDTLSSEAIAKVASVRSFEDKDEETTAVGFLTSNLNTSLSSIFGAIQLPPITVSDHPGFKHNGKPRFRPETQFHLSLGGGNLPEYENSVFFDREITSGAGSRFFTLSSGERFNVELRRFDADGIRKRSYRLDLGINRQTGSGFLFRLSSGLYYGVTRRLQDNFDQVTGTEVRMDTYTREFIVPLEAGIHFTFLKRRRFRPYVGLGVMSYLTYSGVQRITFFDAQTQSEGLVSQLNSRGVDFGQMDFTMTTGFQYKVTSRWSAGLSRTWHSGGNYRLDESLGIEVRHSLK